MRLMNSIILARLISLVIVGGAVFPTFVQAKATSEKIFHDGPCTSESLVLCKQSRPELAKEVVIAEPIKFVNSTSPVKKQNHKPGRDTWKVYQTIFRPAPSAMPARVHNLKDPLAANEKAKDLIKKAPSVLEIIAACESGMKHYNEDTGNVLQGRITPGDVGLLQINSLVHEEQARELGFNIFSIYGNIGYAMKLYIEKGTQPWNSSKKCWGSKIPPQLQLPLTEQT